MNNNKPRLILASNNAHKAQEIKNMIGGIYDILTLKEAGLDGFEPVEDGLTFEENAAKKAIAVYNKTKMPTIADDSGLCVDYLGGRPGVHTARFAGEHATDAENIDRLLSELNGTDYNERTAKFVCVIALKENDSEIKYFRGECEGYILKERRGENGFGYDPVFYYPPLESSLAELSEDEKNKVSHRSRALKKLNVEICDGRN